MRSRSSATRRERKRAQSKLSWREPLVRISAGQNSPANDHNNSTEGTRYQHKLSALAQRLAAGRDIHRSDGPCRKHRVASFASTTVTTSIRNSPYHISRPKPRADERECSGGRAPPSGRDQWQPYSLGQRRSAGCSALSVDRVVQPARRGTPMRMLNRRRCMCRGEYLRLLVALSAVAVALIRRSAVTRLLTLRARPRSRRAP